MRNAAQPHEMFKVVIDKSIQKPFYEQVYQGLSQQIRSGSLPPGTSLPPERQLEEILGITRTTLRQALALLKDDRLIARRQGVGTFVEAPARWKPVQRTISLGIVAWLEKLEGYDQLLSGYLCGEAMRAGMEVKALHWMQNEVSLAQRIQEHGLDGVIALPAVSSESMKQLETLSLPKVILEIREQQPGLDHVVLDADAAVREGVADLIRLGHRSIAFVAGLARNANANNAFTFVPSPDGALRYRSYRLALADGGLDYRPEWYSELRYHITEAERWVNGWLATEPAARPTAVVAFNDHIALDLWQACRQRKLSVPGDLSILGFGCFVPEAEDGSLASATIDFKTMARLAVQRIEERVRRGGMPGVTLHAGAAYKTGRTIGAPRQP